MTAKAEHNPNAGIDRFFTGLTPDSDARAFQHKPPGEKPQSSWRIVSSDGSRSEAEPSSGVASNARSNPEDEELSATEAAFFGQSYPPKKAVKPRPIDLPEAEADAAELALACGVDIARSSDGPADISEEEGYDSSSLPDASARPGSSDEVAQAAHDPHNEGFRATQESLLRSASAQYEETGAWETTRREKSRENYELARVVQAWSQLPPNIRHAILAIIDSL